MIRIFVIAVAFQFATAYSARAQAPTVESRDFPKAVFGIKGGANISRFSASINSESRSKAGLALGVYLKKQFRRASFFRPELYYSNQGQKDNYLYPTGGPSIGRTTTNMHYVNAPFILEFGRKVSFQTGIQVGLLVLGKEKGIVKSVEVNSNLNDVMTTADLSFVAGVGISPSKNLNGGIRINYGISNIYNPEVDQGSSGIILDAVQNRVLHCYVGYSF